MGHFCVGDLEVVEFTLETGQAIRMCSRQMFYEGFWPWVGILSRGPLSILIQVILISVGTMLVGKQLKVLSSKDPAILRVTLYIRHHNLRVAKLISVLVN